MSSDPFQDQPGGYEFSTKGAWVDFLSLFAGVLLLISASFQVLQGLSAIANDDLYAAGSEYLYKFDLTVWGWLHLIWGILSLCVAGGILAGKSWAYLCGIVLVGISMLINFTFLPLYPVWSLTIIGFNVVIIWALCMQVARRG